MRRSLYKLGKRFSWGLFALVSLLWGMPPHPEAFDRLSEAEREEVVYLIQEARERGVDRVGSRTWRNLQQLMRDQNQEIEIRLPVLLVDFSDNPANRDAHPQDYYYELLFSQGELETGSMREWYEENSLGEVVLIGVVSGWYRMPRTYSYYVNQQYGLGAYPRNTQRLAEEAVALADDDLDFSRFDNDGDGVVDAVVVVFAGSGAETNPNNRNIIWSHTWRVANQLEVDGVEVINFYCAPEDGRIGVFGHELGHAVFDLPDLYDGTGRSKGLGSWSMMSYGSWGDNGNAPVHFDAWCKYHLGWGEVITQERGINLTLRPVEESGEIAYLWDPERGGEEFFLGELRMRTGFDRSLPAEGFLIYHIDERVRNNDQAWRPGQDPNRHYKVALEQADGEWDLENNRDYGDDGDPFPGSTGNRTFDLRSIPDSRDYQGNPSGIRIWNITIENGQLNALWDIRDAGERETTQIIPLRDNWNLISLRVIPPHQGVPQVVDRLLEDNNLLIVKDGRGRFFSPRHNYNDIPLWNSVEGYFIKVQRGVNWEVEGEVIHPQTPIPLRAGWQLIPYYPSYRLSAPQAFASLGDALDMVKDPLGRFYVPRYQYNSIPFLMPGQGLLIKMNRASELVYPRQ